MIVESKNGFVRAELRDAPDGIAVEVWKMPPGGSRSLQMRTTIDAPWHVALRAVQRTVDEAAEEVMRGRQRQRLDSTLEACQAAVDEIAGRADRLEREMTVKEKIAEAARLHSLNVGPDEFDRPGFFQRAAARDLLRRNEQHGGNSVGRVAERDRS